MPINPPQAPINYLGAMPQVDIGRDAIEGLQIGAAIRQAREEKTKAQDAASLREQFAKDVQDLLADPTAEAFSKMIVKNPGLREAFKTAFEIFDDKQKDSEFLLGTQAFNAIGNGNTQAAKDILDQQIEGMRNSGKPTEKMEMMRNALESNPDAVRNNLGLVLASVDPDRWSKYTAAASSLEKAEAETSAAQSAARSAAVKAKFAESDAALAQAKTGWDITKLQEDIRISRANHEIATLQAKQDKELAPLKKQEMQDKIDDAKAKRDAAVRTAVAETETAVAAADNLLNTLDKAINMAVKKRDANGKPIEYTETVKRATGPIASKYVPTVRQSTSNFQEVIKTLGSQVVMSRISEIKGVMSDRDLDTLMSSLQSLSLAQSPEQLVGNLLEAQRLTTKARSTTVSKHGAPAATAKKLSVPDTPEARPSPEEIDALVRKYAPDGGN